MRYSIGFGLALVCVSLFCSAQPLSVTLSPQDQAVFLGEGPKFQLEVVSKSGTAKLLDFSRRGDLVATYARIRLLRQGKQPMVPVLISDPGPIAAIDYVTIDSGSSYRFEHRGDPLALSALPVGRYTVSIWITSEGTGSEGHSNQVTFNVKPKPIRAK